MYENRLISGDNYLFYPQQQKELIISSAGYIFSLGTIKLNNEWIASYTVKKVKEGDVVSELSKETPLSFIKFNIFLE